MAQPQQEHMLAPIAQASCLLCGQVLALWPGRQPQYPPTIQTANQVAGAVALPQGMSAEAVWGPFYNAASLQAVPPPQDQEERLEENKAKKEWMKEEHIKEELKVQETKEDVKAEYIKDEAKQQKVKAEESEQPIKEERDDE